MDGKKLFATDFDGTLNNYSEGVTEECLKTIAEFRRRGNIFGIITGRSYENAKRIIESYLKYCDFIACMTGAYVINSNGKVIFEAKGNGEVLPELLKTISEMGCGYLVYSDGKKSYDIDTLSPLKDDGEEMKEIKRHEYFSQVNTCFDPPEHFEKCVEKLTELYGDVITLNVNGHCLDLPPAGVSKGRSVKIISEYFDVSDDNIYTAGDNDNDISMLKMFHGYTLPYGTSACKQYAEKIFNSVGEMISDVMKREC